MRDVEAKPSRASGIGAAKPDTDVHVGKRVTDQPARRPAGVDERRGARAERPDSPPALHLGRFVGYEPTETLGPKALALGQDRMRPQKQRPRSTGIAGEPQIRRRRRIHAADAAVRHDDDAIELRRRSRDDSRLYSSELAAASEPGAQLRARVEPIAGRDNAHRGACRFERTRAVPLIEAGAELPPRESACPVRDIGLQRVVNGWREGRGKWLSFAGETDAPDASPRRRRGERHRIERAVRPEPPVEKYLLAAARR